MNPPFTRRSFLGLATGACAIACGRASAEGEPLSIQAAADLADRLIAQHVMNGGVTSAALLIRQGKFKFARGYGGAKVDTPFLIASPTKPMTASAVMWLRERGQLDLADRVQKYLPPFRGD